MAAKKTKSHTKTIYEMQAEMCSVLAHPVRIQILDLLAEKEKTASELLEVLKIPKANLSQHLAVMKDSGLLHCRKEGLYQYLSLALPKIKDACSVVRGLLIEKMAMEEKHNSEIIRQLRAHK